MSDIITKDVVRDSLKQLIKKSKLKIRVDEVLQQFCASKDKCSKRQLIKILEYLAQNQPNAKEYLAEATNLLEEKEPLYCLMHFLNFYAAADKSVVPSVHSKDLATSTPLLKKPVDMVMPDTVNNIRERIQQAASANCNYTRPCLSSISLQSAVGSPTATMSTPSVAPTTSTFLAPDAKSLSDSYWYMTAVEHYHCRPNNVLATPPSSQENLLMLDLIYCLTGIRGSYITPEDSKMIDAMNAGENAGVGIKFKISEQIHSSLRDIAQEMLPLASHFICVQNFVKKAAISDCGQVLKALSAALRSLLQDYYLLLSQLEKELQAGNLSLHKMLFYVRPTLGTMEVLADTVSEIMQKELGGAAALSLLYKRINSLIGDDESQKFLIQLTQMAAIPYMEILQLWVQKGVIVDPQQEFLVEDNEHVRREDVSQHYSADYWEKRYTIRHERIPCFLEKVSTIILNTGKYLNVIRQCGKKVTPPPTMSLEFVPTSDHHITVIQSAYRFASKNLLEVLLTENDLMGHLMSVKRYLLMHQGDFITQFMDACDDELGKHVDKVLPMTLENLLGLTLRLSSAKHDPYKDDVHCELLPYDLVTQMAKIMIKDEDVEYWQTHERLDLTGLECFAFRYEVKWPVSLVLNHLTISKYQMLFRQLFYCKHVERQLCKVWKENSTAKKFSPQAAELYRSAFTLRQRMMNAIQNIEYYMMIEVIEPNWHIFLQNMSKVENIDGVLSCHQDFLDSCLKNCMLTDCNMLNRTIFKLCNVSLKFCEFIQSESSLAPNETFSERVKRFELEFTGLLIGLLKQINDVAFENPSERFINLVHRINFNSFYSDEIEKLCAKDSMPSIPKAAGK